MIRVPAAQPSTEQLPALDLRRGEINLPTIEFADSESVTLKDVRVKVDELMRSGEEDSKVPRRCEHGSVSAGISFSPPAQYFAQVNMFHFIVRT